MALKSTSQEAIQAWKGVTEPESILRSIFLAAPVGIGLVQDRVIRQVNNEICRMTGYSADEILGRNARFLYPTQEEYDMVGEVKYEQIRRQGTGTVETRWIRKDGVVIDIILSSTPLNPRDLSEGVTFTAMDISLRRKAEGQRDLLFNHSIDMLCIAGTDGYLKQVNPAWEQTLGWTSQELVSRPFLDFVHPDDIDATRGALQRLSDKEPIHAFTLRCRCRDGSYRLLCWNVIPIEEDDLLLAVARDITESKAVEGQLQAANQQLIAANQQLTSGERALRESEERFRLMFQNLNEGVVVFSAVEDCADFVIRSCNPAVEQMEGIVGHEVVGRRVSQISPCFAEPGFVKILQEVHRTGTPREFSQACTSGRGQRRWMKGYAYRLPTQQIVVIYRDESARKHAEDALRESELRYRMIFESAAALILSVDRHGTIININPRSSDVLGYQREELLGRPLQTILHPSSYESAREAIRIIFEQGSLRNHMKKMIRKDGTVIDVRVNSSLLRGVTSESDRTVCIIEDETRQLRVQAELEKAARLESLGVLAGGIAHDFNNLLGGLFGYIDLAAESEDCGAGTQQFLKKALKSYQRARDLTLQLLTFSKGGAPAKRAYSIETLVREASALAVSGSSVRCRYRVEDALWYADVDVGQVSQVINNIVINARQAMGENGAITIRMMNRVVAPGENIPVEPGKYVAIAITDTGIGVSPDQIDRVFDPFFTTKQQGSGLGLAVSFSIVKRHGGHISLTSKPGIGSTFTVLLPASSGTPEPQKEEELMISRGNSERILVMDDEELILEMSQRLLERLGYRVEKCTEGAEAAALYKNARDQGDPFDLVILDLTISGGMGGIATLQQLKNIDPDVKAIVSSGYSEEPVMCSPEEYGFKGCIAKPYRVGEFAATLRRALTE